MFLATGIVDATWAAIQSGLVALVSFLPALIGALLIIVIGWFVAGIVGRLATALLSRVGFDAGAERAGLAAFLRRAGASRLTASGVMGELVKWFFRLIFLEAAASALHLDAITGILNQIVLFIPNLVVAIVVVMVGFLVARLAAALVRGAVGESGLANPEVFAGITRYAIMAFAVIVAMEQIGVGTTLVNLLFGALVAALALAFGLAFGLGGRDVAGQVWRGWYSRTQTTGARADRRPLQSAAPRGSGAMGAAPAGAVSMHAEGQGDHGPVS
jgi:hypothetical protein